MRGRPLALDLEEFRGKYWEWKRMGYTDKRVAIEMYVDPRTVDHYKRRLGIKTGRMKDGKYRDGV